MERSTATASLSSFIMPNLMILALARRALRRAPVDDISLNLHKVMKAGNGRTKQFTCWHGKKWFANTGGVRERAGRRPGPRGAGMAARGRGKMGGGGEGIKDWGGLGDKGMALTTASAPAPRGRMMMMVASVRNRFLLAQSEGRGRRRNWPQ